MKVWITKYALTKGIYTVTGNIWKEDADYFSPCGAGLYSKRDWHTTFALAKERAEEMKANKLKSLSRQIERILYMKFDNPDLDR